MQAFDQGSVISRSNKGQEKSQKSEEVKRIMNWGLCWFEHLSLVEELEQVLIKNTFISCERSILIHLIDAFGYMAVKN